MRTGLLKVGLPGAKEGLSDQDPTLAEMLKPLGYVTGQFGNNRLGDRMRHSATRPETVRCWSIPGGRRRAAEKPVLHDDADQLEWSADWG